MWHREAEELKETIGLRVSGQGFNQVVPRVGAPSLAATPQVLRVECDGTRRVADSLKWYGNFALGGVMS